MKVFVRKSFKENKSYHLYFSSLPTVSQYFGKFSFRRSTIYNRQSSGLISMSAYSQRSRMMLAKIERHVQKCDEMWWNEILSRKFPCYYFCIIFNKSSLKNVYIIRKVRFFIAIHRLVCFWFMSVFSSLATTILVLWQLRSKIENGVDFHVKLLSKIFNGL